MSKHWRIVNLASVLLLMVPHPTLTQTLADNKLQPKSTARAASETNDAELLQAQRRMFAIGLLTALGDDARSYRNLALRSRVMARVADALWNSDSDMARVLFRRAWEAAEVGDAEELPTNTKDNTPPMVIALRRVSGGDLRLEVLSLTARHDRELVEELLAKLQDDTTSQALTSSSDGNNSNSADSWSSEGAMAKRLMLARRLLDDGQIDQAIELAASALNKVSANSIGFLSVLRQKRPEAADRSFALLLAQADIDPSSDANTASGLSSYVLTPGLYITFNVDGTVRWTQPEEITAPPNLPAALRNKFFQVAASILLRPVPRGDQDTTTSGRIGKYMVIKRLLPLFDKYSADTASALRAQISVLAGNQGKAGFGDEHSLLTEGLQPEDPPRATFEKMQDRLARAKTSRERDLIYADAAATFANQGDERARELADKIDDSARRIQARRYVDLKFVQLAVKKKQALEVGRLARAGELTHTQRAWAYTQSANLLLNSDSTRSLEFLTEATDEARRIEFTDPDRARSLIGVAKQFLTADRVRAWEIMGEAIKSANSADEFNGEATQFHFALGTNSGLKIIDFGDEKLGLSSVLRVLGKDDLYRSIDLARSFKNDAPRANATLAVACAVLEK